MGYKVLGVSSGIGVSLWPFKDNIIGNIEPRAVFHSKGEKQWVKNFGDIPLWRDIPEINLKPDVIISSPDCGSGSILRYSRAKKLGDHKLNKSLMLTLGAIAKYKPKIFYFENLPNIWKSFPKERFIDICRNYKLIELQSSVSAWGNSQIYRKRLVIIGVHWDLANNINAEKIFRLPDYRHKNKTCYELYGDLDNLIGDKPNLGHAREDITQPVTMYAGYKIPIWQVFNIWQGELRGKRRWAVTDRKFSTAPGVYRNRKNDYPATARKANRQFDHNGNMLTPRQLARIQGVPDDFKIYIDADKLNYWINKGRAAVTKTPPMEISYWLKKKLDKIL